MQILDFSSVSAASRAKRVLSLESWECPPKQGGGGTNGRKGWETQSCSLPLCNNSKKHLEIFSGSVSHSALMFLWRKELQIHEHRVCASAADILEQVDDLVVFVCI